MLHRGRHSHSVTGSGGLGSQGHLRRTEEAPQTPDSGCPMPAVQSQPWRAQARGTASAFQPPAAPHWPCCSRVWCKVLIQPTKPPPVRNQRSHRAQREGRQAITQPLLPARRSGSVRAWAQRHTQQTCMSPVCTAGSAGCRRQVPLGLAPTAMAYGCHVQ